MKRTSALVLVILLMAGAAMAQMHEQGTNALHNQAALEQTINNFQGLDAGMRDQMLGNLDQCRKFGMGPDQINTLFEAGGPMDPDMANRMLSRQHEVLALAEAGLPTGPMIDKISEGHMKNIPPERMDQVLGQLRNNLETAHMNMMQAVADGVREPATQAGMHRANTDLARCLWDGLAATDMSAIEEHAGMRAQNGSCAMDDFVAANQVATRFMDSGMDRGQAVDMAGDAIMHGYSPDQMGAMGSMMMVGSEDSDHHQEMMNRMQEWVHAGMDWDEMTEHMIEGGWMGPADMMGPGGCNPMDNMGMSGPGHDGGMMGGDHDHDGMGGGGDGGGMGGGGDGGGMGGGGDGGGMGGGGDGGGMGGGGNSGGNQ